MDKRLSKKYRKRLYSYDHLLKWVDELRLQNEILHIRIDVYKSIIEDLKKGIQS